MIKLHNSKQVCFSKIWLQWVWICKLNWVSCLTKNAILGFNLCNWVQLIYQIDLKELFKTRMLHNRKLSLLQINRKMLLLICKHRFPKLRLQLQLLLTMPRLKLMLPSQQIWPRWKLIYWLHNLKPMHINLWKLNSDSLTTSQFLNILKWKQSMDTTKEI